MSNEKMREEFEAWVVPYSKERLYSYPDFVLKRIGDRYATTWVDSMWVGWQASRAAIEVDLPSRLTQDGRSICIDKDGEFLEYCDVVGEIKSLGLRVKP